MKVIAATGLRVPKEGKPREYITDAQAQDVEMSAYYVRRMADQELLEVADEQARPTELASKASKATKDGSAA